MSYYNESKTSLINDPLFLGSDLPLLLDRMTEDLNKFKRERNDSINEDTYNYSTSNSKEVFYSSLEQLLLDIVYITSSVKKREAITSVYKWYNNKVTYFNNLATLRYKSTSSNQFELNEIHSELTSRPTPTNPRSIDNNCTDPKWTLHQYKTKKPFKVKSKSLLSNSLMDFTSTLGSTKAFTRYSNQHQKVKEKADQAPPASSWISQPIKEPSNFFSLKRQCDIITGKHKALSTKRHLEEVKTMLNEYGFIRSRFKQDQLKRLNIKKVIGSYSTDQPIPMRKRGPSIQQDEREAFIKLDANESKLFMNKMTIRKGLNPKTGLKPKRFNLDLTGRKHKQSIADINFSQSMKEDNVPNDIVSAGSILNPLFKERFSQQGILNIQQSDSCKQMTSMHYEPLSVFDLKHIELKPSERKCEEGFPELSTSCEWAKKLFNSSPSYLDLRKTMEKHKLNEFISLNKQLHQRKRQLNKSALLDSFLPPKEDQFLMSFLPKTEQGLLLSNPK